MPLIFHTNFTNGHTNFTNLDVDSLDVGGAFIKKTAVSTSKFVQFVRIFVQFV
jgi:hypothetical protein